MAKIFNELTELIGGTPLLRLKRYEEQNSINAKLLGKLEYFNPAGSIKDRAAMSMIADAQARGLLKEGSVIVEPTSGNTGIGLAAVAAVRGYRLILTMPETMSAERRALLKAYGAELVLTEGARGMSGAIEKAEQLAASIPGAFIPGQFKNPANSQAHKNSTGPEIWTDTDGQIDIFVACVGTGGTISGAGGYLKSKNPAIRVIAAEPAESPVLSGGEAGSHIIQGIGAGFIPALLDDIYDEVVTVSGEEAISSARGLVRTEGLLVGISSGAALAAAVKLAQRRENAGKNIVAIFPDTGERYLSTALFAQ